MAKKQRTMTYAPQGRTNSAAGRPLGPPPPAPAAPPVAPPDTRAIPKHPTPGTGLLPRSVGELLTRWFSIDLRTLAAFRMGLALLVFGDMWVRIPDIAAQYTETGVWPLEAARMANNTDWTLLSPYMWAESSSTVGLLFAITMLACVAMFAGWRTRLSTFVVWMLMCSLHTRMAANLHSGDVLERMMLFWSLFLPLGARWSLDGGAAGWKARGLTPPRRHLSFGSAGLLLQIVTVYLMTVILKSGAEWHEKANAVYYALALDSYRTWFGGWLYSQRWTYAPLTHFTMILEAAVAPVAFSPIATGKVRSFLVAMMWGFHTIALNMAFDLGSFPYVCTVAWIAFLPSGWWDAAEQMWRKLPVSPAKKTITETMATLIAWRNRRVVASAKKGHAPMRLRPSRLGLVVAALAIAYVGWFNFRGLNLPFMSNWVTTRDSKVMEGIMWTARLDQDWRMFAPRPSDDDGWFIIAGRTMAGDKYNLIRGARPLNSTKPDVPRDYPSERWRKYMMNLWGRGYANYRKYYLTYIMREWNKTHPGEDSLEKIDMIYMMELTKPDFTSDPPKPIIMDFLNNPTPGSVPPVYRIQGIYRPQ